MHKDITYSSKRKRLNVEIIVLVTIIFLFSCGLIYFWQNVKLERLENKITELEAVNEILLKNLKTENRKKQEKTEYTEFRYIKEYARMKSRDSERASDIRQIQFGIELYYDEKSRYPGVYGTESWDIMKKEIESENIIAKVPEDPGEYKYFYVPFENEYVLGATLEQEDHYLLEKDFDNFNNKNINLPKNISCEDPVFCTIP